MSELRPLVDRQMERVQLRPYEVEDFRRRHDRKRRKERIAAAVVAIVIVTAVFGTAAKAVLGQRAVPADRGNMPVPGVPTSTNGKIVFNANLGEAGSDFFDSFTVDPDGSDLTQVGPAGTTTCGDNDDPWSPDGTRIVCMVFGSDGSLRTATVNGDGSNFTVLSDPKLPSTFGCGGWSPDGTRLLCPFTSDGVYTVKTDGKGLLRLTATSAGQGPSGYAKNGSHAYFTVQDPGTEHRTLYSVNADGSGGLTELSPSNVSVHDNAYFDGVSADSSPDGSEVVFAADVTNTQRALYVVNIDGSGLHRLKMPAGVNPMSAQWSPNGNWIAFSGSPPASRGYVEIYLIHPNGSGLEEITSPTSGCLGFVPIWSPDGTKLLFERQCYSGSLTSSLETVNLDGTGLSKVADLNGLTGFGWGKLATG